MKKSSGMVDVGKKRKTDRFAIARASVVLPEEILNKIRDDEIPKGNVLESARIAGIMAAKKVDTLIPLCHNIEIECVRIEFVFKKKRLLIESKVKSNAKTGVEMEAMTACSVAALTVYDMCKMFSKSIEITDVYLIEKQGGKSGVYGRETA